MLDYMGKSMTILCHAFCFYKNGSFAKGFDVLGENLLH
ncbi:hypothetical protein BCE_1985 [Bacillus cereus ATCC 10987]|uniref:Uncharacterized protein n=1 Tax=Bacillus cereus (strain ATCC 10987 / NRS 248) TaxID=222523 RepID=Q73A02_BACC1|nr:hypothetical protein BCE_1985 [Bacillus cereus ATCC 10987]